VHDLSDGGLLVAAAEMALASRVGLFIDDLPEGAAQAVLLGEDQARYLIALPQEVLDMLDEAAVDAGVRYHVLGRAGGCEVAVKDLFAIDLEDLRTAHEGWMPAYMETPA
jgi:phosphoribosylformylglycinamidine (FGAM) synthase-like enzyme